MSYLLSCLAHNVAKLNCGSFRCTTNLLLRNNLNVAYLASCNNQIQAKQRGVTAIDQSIKKLDYDARRLGRLSYNDVKSVFEVIKATRSASVTQSLMIIRCCGTLLIEEPPEKRTKLVQEMWKTLESLGISLDISHYNALLRVYLENEYDFMPSDVLADLEKRGLEPNRVTYQRLITRYCQKGDITGATRILEFMREKEMPVNVTVFNALIMGHSQSNDMASAEGILNVMKQANIEPTGETYSLLICGYVKQGDLEKAKNILHTCEARETLFADKEYFDVVYSLAKFGYEDEVDQLLPKLRRIPGYNQEAMNSIYRLLAIGKIETSFKVLKTMVRSTKSDGTVLPVGGFFIAYLIRSDYPPETVAKFCQELMKENINQFAFNVAMENSLRFQKQEIALFLFKIAKENGVSLRQHFFWPLLALHGKKKDKSGILNVLVTMHQEFGMPANTETMREFVVPNLISEYSDIESLLMDLKGCGCTIAGGVSSIVHHYLSNNEIEKAASVAGNFRAYYAPFIIRRPLVNAFLHSNNVKSFVLVLREIASGIHWRASLENEKVDEEEVQTVPDHRETISQIIKDVISEFRKDSQSSLRLQQLLKEMLNQGLGLTPKAAQQTQLMLQNQLTPEISELLEKLTTDEFATPVVTTKSSKISIGSLDENSLERLRETMKANNESLNAVQKQLFSVYARNQNLEKLLKLKEEMDAENFVYTLGMKAMLINTFVENNKVDEALQLYNSICKENPEFSLNSVKLLRFALLLIQNDKIEKAFEILNKKFEIETKDVAEVGSFVTSSLCWRILNVFAEKGDVDRVYEFFDLFIKRELTEVNNILLGPLIKVHLQRNDVDAAMKAFEKCCEKYRATPWKNELARIFIEKEDATNLQKLTDLSTPIHGEVNSLYDLMLSFLECGRIRQAKKILETPGLVVRHDRIQNACNRYTNEGAVDHLENLLALTKDISSVNRSELCYSMLLAHDRSDNPQKALGLWMQMQEDDVQPSAKFLYLLASILKRHRIHVPFTVPSQEEVENSTEVQSRDKIRVSKSSQNLRKLLNSGDVDKALEVKRNLGAEKLNKTDWSLLIFGCVNQNRLKDAHHLMEELYSRINQFPHVRYFKSLLVFTAESGDIEFFNTWKNRIPEDLRKKTSFENRRLRAYVTADKIEVYLDDLENKLDQIKNEAEFRSFEASFPKGGLQAVMASKPELISRVKAITKKCEEKGFDSTVFDNFWWIHLMSTKQIDAAQKLWDEKIKPVSSNISFGRLCSQIIRNSDSELAKTFLNMLLSKTNISPGVLGIAYGTLISTLTQRNEIKEALNYLEEAVEKVPLSLIIRSSLNLLQSACEVKNISFPYTLPTLSGRRQQFQEDGSDSDSD